MTIGHYPKWLTTDEAQELYQVALNMDLKQYPVTVWDKTFLQPRLTAWCCDTGQGYRYSNQETPPVEWPQKFLDVRKRLEGELERKFPCCLVNHYRDGQDSVGWHRDDEKQFGSNMLIASISLGATRRFKMKKHEGLDPQDIELSNGDLLVFTNEWAHTIPKTAKEVDPRISLTYRTVEK